MAGKSAVVGIMFEMEPNTKLTSCHGHHGLCKKEFSKAYQTEETIAYRSADVPNHPFVCGCGLSSWAISHFHYWGVTNIRVIQSPRKQ